MARKKTKKPSKLEVCGESCTLHVAVHVVSKLLSIPVAAAAGRIFKHRERAVKTARAAAVASVVPAAGPTVSSTLSFLEMKDLFAAFGFKVSSKISTSTQDKHNVQEALSRPNVDDVIVVAGKFNFDYQPELAPAEIEILPTFCRPNATAVAIRELEERLRLAKELGVPAEACAGDKARMDN